MFDENGKKLEEAGPSVPVRVLGLNAPPQPGEAIESVKNDKIGQIPCLEDTFFTLHELRISPITGIGGDSVFKALTLIRQFG